MGGETTDASAEYPQDNTITSGLIPQTEVDKKYKFLHEDITKCLQDMDEATPRLEALEECFELFHPNDVDRELLITRTLLHHRGEMSAAITAAGIQLRKSLVEFMRANLNAAKHQLETGEKTGRLSAIHPEESRFFGGFYLRLVVPLNIDLEYHQDSRNLRDQLTYHQDHCHVWADTLRWLTANFILFWLTSLVLLGIQNKRKLFEFPWQVITGALSSKDCIAFGIVRQSDEEDIQLGLRVLFAVFMLWALFYGVLIRLLIGTKAGKQYPWILKVSHVFLAIGMGIGAQILGSTPDQDHVHKLNFGAAVMIIPQMLNSLILAVALTISPHATGKMFGKLFIMMGSFASAAILGAIYQQPKFSPIIVIPTGLVAAGWCLMLNHDRRLMDCLEDFKLFNHNSKLKLQGWLFPSIWLLPFVFVGIVGLALATIAASIAVFLLIMLIVGALTSDGDKSRRNTRQRRANDELAGGMVEAGGEGCMAGSCFAFVIFGNLIQCITMQETCRTKYLDYKCD